MNGLGPHQSVTIYSNGSGPGDSAYYEIMPSGVLAKLYSVNGDVRIEFITNVPGLSEANRLRVENGSPPPLGIEVHSNGVIGTTQLFENRSKATQPSSPETPTNQIASQPLTMPATPRALRQAGPSVMLNRMLSFDSPCPTFGGPPSPTFVHNNSPEPTLGGRRYNSSPFSPCQYHPFAGMKPFRKEASPDPTEIVGSDSENEQDEFPTMSRTGVTNGYGQFVLRRGIFGKGAGTSTEKTKRAGHRGVGDAEALIPAASIEVPHGLGERSALPRSSCPKYVLLHLLVA